MTTGEGSVRLRARVRGPASDLAFAVTDAACWAAVLRRPGSVGDGDPGSDTAGTFRAACSRSEADAVVEAARRAVSALEGVGGDTGWSLDVDGRSVVVPHTVAVDTGLDAAADPLIARALQSPVSAVRLESYPVDVPGMGRMLGFTFVSLGTEAVSVLLDADRFEATTDTGELVSLAAPTLGLVDGDGTLRDGIRALAVLPQGRRAACSFPLDEIDERSTGGSISGRLASAGASGSIVLTGPWADDGVQAFTVRAAVRAVPNAALS